MSVDYRAIGQRIKQKRKAMGKTQEAMAEALFVTVGYISQIERGVTKINLDTLSEIAVFLRCDIAELITGAILQREDYLDPEFERELRRLPSAQKKTLLEIARVLSRHRESS